MGVVYNFVTVNTGLYWFWGRYILIVLLADSELTAHVQDGCSPACLHKPVKRPACQIPTCYHSLAILRVQLIRGTVCTVLMAWHRFHNINSKIFVYWLLNECYYFLENVYLVAPYLAADDLVPVGTKPSSTTILIGMCYLRKHWTCSVLLSYAYYESIVMFIQYLAF